MNTTTRKFIKSKDGSRYELVSKIGEGSYGKVFLAKCCRSGEMVALKGVDLLRGTGAQKSVDQNGMSASTAREIKHLMQFRNHENIVNLKGVAHTDDGSNETYLVLEYCPHDLAGIIGNAQMVVDEWYEYYCDDIEIRFNEPLLKGWMQQILRGVARIHESGSMHRDLKPANVLVTRDCVLKIADFGLSTSRRPQDGRLTNNVTTIWYRAPELLLGATQYSNAVDMWSVGCIFGELLIKRALIPGDNEFDQLDKIFELCGTPTTRSWHGVGHLPFWDVMQPKQLCRSQLRQRFHHFLDYGMHSMIDLLERMLVLDPSRRITAREALSHKWFSEEPKPDSYIPLPMRSRTEAWIRKLREQQRRQSDLETADTPRTAVDSPATTATTSWLSPSSFSSPSSSRITGKKRNFEELVTTPSTPDSSPFDDDFEGNNDGDDHDNEVVYSSITDYSPPTMIDLSSTADLSHNGHDETASFRKRMRMDNESNSIVSETVIAGAVERLS